jgi:hypothetical protein
VVFSAAPLPPSSLFPPAGERARALSSSFRFPSPARAVWARALSLAALSPNPHALSLSTRAHTTTLLHLQKDKIGDNPTDDEIKGYLKVAPKPSAECCTKVRPFIAAACACDEDVLYMVGRSGVTKKTMGLLSRAVPFTACNTPTYGPAIKDGCKKA